MTQDVFPVEDSSVNKNKFKAFCLDVLNCVVIPVLITFLILRFVAMLAYVPTGSMKPTIFEGDRILVLRYLHNSSFNRGDLVVFSGKSVINENKLLVKRVIGLPGETVSIKDGVVYINAVPLQEDYVKNNMNFNMTDLVIPEGEYFVLGDNRINSYDARYWDVKTVKQADIIGKGKVLFKRDNG